MYSKNAFNILKKSFGINLCRLWTFSWLGCLADAYRAAVDRGMVGRRVHLAVKLPSFQGKYLGKTLAYMAREGQWSDWSDRLPP